MTFGNSLSHFSERISGMHALNSLRLEKAFRHWGHDIADEDTPLEAGLGFAVKFEKPGGFIGRDALLRQKEEVYKSKNKANETGELVLTTLGRYGSPLLRYQTGDLVKASKSSRCSCGTYNLRLDGGILGRVDDMLVIRGVNVYPSAIEEIIRDIGGVDE